MDPFREVGNLINLNEDSNQNQAPEEQEEPKVVTDSGDAPNKENGHGPIKQNKQGEDTQSKGDSTETKTKTPLLIKKNDSECSVKSIVPEFIAQNFTDESDTRSQESDPEFQSLENIIESNTSEIEIKTKDAKLGVANSSQTISSSLESLEIDTLVSQQAKSGESSTTTSQKSSAEEIVLKPVEAILNLSSSTDNFKQTLDPQEIKPEGWAAAQGSPESSALVTVLLELSSAGLGSVDSDPSLPVEYPVHATLYQDFAGFYKTVDKTKPSHTPESVDSKPRPENLDSWRTVSGTILNREYRAQLLEDTEPEPPFITPDGRIYRSEPKLTSEIIPEPSSVDIRSSYNYEKKCDDSSSTTDVDFLISGLSGCSTEAGSEQTDDTKSVESEPEFESIESTKEIKAADEKLKPGTDKTQISEALRESSGGVVVHFFEETEELILENQIKENLDKEVKSEAEKIFGTEAAVNKQFDLSLVPSDSTTKTELSVETVTSNNATTFNEHLTHQLVKEKSKPVEVCQKQSETKVETNKPVEICEKQSETKTETKLESEKESDKPAEVCEKQSELKTETHLEPKIESNKPREVCEKQSGPTTETKLVTEKEPNKPVEVCEKQSEPKTETKLKPEKELNKPVEVCEKQSETKTENKLKPEHKSSEPAKVCEKQSEPETETKLVPGKESNKPVEVCGQQSVSKTETKLEPGKELNKPVEVCEKQSETKTENKLEPENKSNKPLEVCEKQYSPKTETKLESEKDADETTDTSEDESQLETEPDVKQAKYNKDRDTDSDPEPEQNNKQTRTQGTSDNSNLGKKSSSTSTDENVKHEKTGKNSSSEQLLQAKIMVDQNEKLQMQQEISDLKLQLNACQQDKATLELEIRQKEEIIIKTQAELLKAEQQEKQEIKLLKDKLKEKSKLIEKDSLQEALKEAQAREAKAVSELSARSKDEVNYQKIMNEYESTIAGCVANYQKLKAEYDTATRHLANLELAFSDVHQKYERSKIIIEGFKSNEDTLRQNLHISDETIKQHEEKYESLKAHAKTQIEKSNKEILTLRDRYEIELSKLKAFIKRLEIKCSSLETTLDQKTQECAALSALCDEVTGKKV